MFDQLPVAAADGAVGEFVSAAVVGEVPEEIGAGELGLAGEFTEQADAVDFAACGQGAADDLADGGQDVDAANGGGAGGIGGDDAGPFEQPGFANAAFVSVAFARAEGLVVGDGFEAAVVGGEDDQGVTGEVEGFDFVEHGADGVVDTLDHGGVIGAEVFPAGGFGFVFEIVGVVFAGLNGGVDGVMGHVKEEGFIVGGGVLDEIDGFVGQPVGQVFAFLAVGESGDLAGIEIAFEGMAPTAAADIDVEALRGRVEAGAAQVPFADVTGLVIALLEDFGNGDIRGFEEDMILGGVEFPFGIGVEALGVFGGFAGPDPVGDPDAGRVAAGEQGGPSG